MDEHRPLRTFGRIKARTLKPRQAGLMDTLLPHLAVPPEGDLLVPFLFGDDGLRPTVLEIGFGGGEHLVTQAQAQPDWRFIGVEPFVNGVASCLRHIEESGVQNVRLHAGDARDVIKRLPIGALRMCYILFPDPWPKLRHHKRRLIQPSFLDDLANAMELGGYVRFATDWANYASWTLEHFSRDRRFDWIAERAEDWRTPWPGHVTTRYEAKKLGDCAPIWLTFIRNEQSPKS